MCGIVGALNDNRNHVLKGMLKRIQHRGPDDQGMRDFDDISLGNVRLSIIDAAKGHQPLSDTSGSYWIVYNGELYGYKKNRENCIREGYEFKTDSDTEVVLALYRNHGIQALSELNGMFSFCLYDRQKDVVIIARDHFGIKPVVYAALGPRFYFSSEIKAFYAIPEWKPIPDMNAWHTFFNIRFPPSPSTLFKGVKKIPPGCYICLYKGDYPFPKATNHLLLETLQYGQWHGGLYRYYGRSKKTINCGYGDALVKLKGLLNDSVSSQLVADVDVGLFVSGGIDSSALALIASSLSPKPLASLCLGFNEPSDENNDARIVANSCYMNHRDVYLEHSPFRHYQKIVYYMEEPKVNCIQGFLLSKEARKFQKVMLSGLGGDELFGGYDIYMIALYLDMLRGKLANKSLALAMVPFRKLLTCFSSMGFDTIRRGVDILNSLSHPLDMYLLLRNSWDHDHTLRKEIYANDPIGSSALCVKDNFNKTFRREKTITESFMSFEFDNKMVDDFLANEDRMSMAHGLEVRVPFLDKNVVEFVQSLPLQFKIGIGFRKKIVHSLLSRSLPHDILHKKKHGFTINPVYQFKNGLNTYVQKYLSKDRIEESGLFNYSFVQKVLQAKPSKTLRWHYFLLWKIMGYHIWEDVFIKGGGSFE